MKEISRITFEGKLRGAINRSFRASEAVKRKKKKGKIKKSCTLTSSKILPTFAVTNKTGTLLPAILQCVKGKF